jgi:hypothetical protein
MTEISYATAVDPRTLPFTDRRTSMKVAGVLLILFGSIFACFGALTPLGMYASTMIAARPPTTQGAPVAPVAPPVGPDMKTMALAGITYLVMAALTIWVGIGSVKVRRWARPVLLVVGWTWLAMGVISFGHWILFGASMREMMTAGVQPGGPQPPVAMIRAMTAVMGVMMFVFMVVLPALLVWLYRRRGVRETVEFFDRRYAWTDRCPTPVLAVSMWLIFAAVGSVVYSMYAVFPLFGRFVTGPAAIAALLAVAAVFGWLAWGAYRLKSWAWWGAAFVWTLWAGSMVWTFTSLGYSEFYRQAGYSPREVDMMMRYSGQMEDSTVWMIALSNVAMIAYLLYVRKYFVAGPPPEPGAEPMQSSPPAEGATLPTP